MMINEPATTAQKWWRPGLPFLYRRHVAWGRICGALRVLIGKNASIPKGLTDTGTALGKVRVNDYYGGCILSLPEADLYWHAWGFDGWGAGPGQAEFERADLPEAPAGLSA
jgi:hypothetical protein